ncbi:MAG: DUF5615 family PIN-like protein [Deltaproteobacteria bacterium]|nr:DUF5615 family PIN-like protein [Deltaproteobacteria bacterium]
MKIVIDMNLSPQWVKALKQGGHEAVHWSDIGEANAIDRVILAWARSNGFVVFTHDLDFGAILAATDAKSPSVLQIRTQDVSAQHIGKLVLSVLEQFDEILEKGALISVDEKRARARILPISMQE